MMDSAAVNAMADKLLEEQTPETNPVVEEVGTEKPSEPETNAGEVVAQEENPDVGGKSTEQEAEDKPVEGDPKSHSHEDQAKYAFKKLKAKERAKRDKIVAEYESQISQLKGELEKYQGLKKADFDGDDEAYMKYLVEQNSMRNKVDSLNSAKERAEAEEFAAINQARIENCFPDEKDRESYMNLMRNGGSKFLADLDRVDPENAILGYLDDSDMAPLLIRVLMTRPEYRNEVFSKRSPYSKVIALDNLSKQLSYAKGLVDRKRAGAKTEAKPKPEMPVIGRQTKTDASAPVSDDQDWNAMLRNMNQARKYR